MFIYYVYNIESVLCVESSLSPQEEREVLASIYEADRCFREVSANTFSYRVCTAAIQVAIGTP